MPGRIVSAVLTAVLCFSSGAFAIEKLVPTPDPNPYYGESPELINPFDGQFKCSSSDISIKNAGYDLEFLRFYSSASAAGEIKGMALPAAVGRMGAGWSTNYDYNINLSPAKTKKSKNKTPEYTLQCPGGAKYTLVPESTGAKKEAAAVQEVFSVKDRPWKMERSGAGFILYMENKVYGFDAAGILTGIRNRAGQGVAVSYDGATATVTDNYERKLFIFKNEDGLIVSVTTNMAGVAGIAFTYEKAGGTGLLKTADRPGLEDAEYGYFDETGPKGMLSYLRDLKIEGKTKEIIFAADGASGRYTGAAYANGETACGMAYKKGNKTDVIDGQGTRSYGFYPDGAVKSTAHSGGAVESMEYDASGRIIKRFFRSGRTEEYTYDANGYLREKKTAWMDPVDGKRNMADIFNYDQYGCLLSLTDGTLRTQMRGYDAAGRLISVSKGTAGTVYEYNEAGLVSVEKDSEKAFRLYSYDKYGNIIKITSGPAVYEQSFGYDDAFRVSSFTAEDGVRMQYTYSAVFPSKLEGIYMDGREVGRYEYDKRGNLSSFTDDYGKVSYSYDADALTGESDRAGLVKNYSFDKFGRVKEAWDNTGRRRKYIYNESGLVKEIFDSNSQIYYYGYDSAGNTETVKDRNGNITRYSYDGLARLRSRTLPGGTWVLFDYDNIGNKTAVSYEKNSAVFFIYDQNERLVWEAYADGSHFEYKYSPEGDLTEVAIFDTYKNKLKRQDLGYDGNHRLTGDEFYNYEYGAAGFAGAGRVVRAVGIGTETSGTFLNYSYDKKGRMTYDCGVENVIYENTRKRTVRTGGGAVYDVYFDGQGRSVEIVERAGGANEDLKIKRDPAGRITGLIYPNGNESKFTYDPEGNAVSCVNSYLGKGLISVIDSATAGRDYEGNRTADKDVRQTAGKTLETLLEYKYDTDSRLQSMTGGFTWAYDGKGNRLYSREQAAGDRVYRPDIMDRYDSTSGDLYSYDIAGNLVSPAGIFAALDNISYVENFHGYCGIFDDNSKLIKMILGLAHNDDPPVVEYDNGSSYKVYLTDGKQAFGAVEKTASGEIHRTYIMPDLNGSAAVLCGENGALISGYEYSPFGVMTAPNSGDGNVLRYEGMNAAVSASYTVNMGHNRYDAKTGRLISRDKNNIFDGRNFYEYSGNNPFKKEEWKPFINGVEEPDCSIEKKYFAAPEYPAGM